MKVSGKGIMIILLFLVAIPGTVDLIVSTVLPGRTELHFSMTGFLLPRYIRWLPVYLAYLVIAFMIISLIKKHRESSNPQK